MANIKLKCESCGNEIKIDTNQSATICEYCGNSFDIPQSEERDNILNLYSRADNAWEHRDYDEALQLYNQIIREEDHQAKAHFSAALCRYGITYEVDPGNGRKVPICNRFNKTSILDDKNYQIALKYASENVRASYKKTGEAIDKITKAFLKIVDKEAPYDVFISYKRTGADGNLTEDSKHARKLYYYLTDKKYKVFFAEITLQNIAGENYEPYIFAALSSAPVMVLLGSSKENMESTWVRNEWKRFLNLESQGEKKTLIPCYLKMDPYDLPGEIRSKQSMNVDDITFHEDITMIVEKKVSDARKNRSIKEGKTLADRYATPDKVKRVVDELDCEEDHAAEVLIIHQGHINNAISYISQEEDYQKKLWICAECGSNNTHAVCHNENCALTRSESFQVSKKREIIKRNSIEEKEKRAAKLRKARPAIIIISAIIAALCITFAIIGGLQTSKVNKLLDKIPKTISDYSRFENEIVAAYTAYDDMWDIYKGFVDGNKISNIMDDFNIYRVGRIKSTLLDVTLENSKDSDILKQLSSYYKQLTPEQTGLLSSEEFGNLETMNCIYETIQDIDTIMNDVVKNYDMLSGIKKNYNSLSAEYQAYVHNISKLDGVTDYYNLFSNLDFISADGGWAIKVKEGKADSITGNVVLPSTYKGQEVVTIAEKAFAGCSAMTSVTVPDSVKTIGYAAFSGCAGLKSITLPFVGQTRTSESNDGTGHFGYIFGKNEYTGSTKTYQSTYVYYEGNDYYIPSQLRSVTITDTLQITKWAFQNCSMLTEINLTDKIIAVGNSSFEKCNSISHISLPNVTSLPESIFKNCSSLESFTIGNSVIDIGSSAFSGCHSLQSINSDENGKFVIPSHISTIGYAAFSGCINLKDITLPFIGNSSVGIRNDGTGLFGYIFGQNEYTGSIKTYQHTYVSYEGNNYYIPAQLKNVTITNAIKIEQWAFENCSMLTSLKINTEASNNVGTDAFKNCISPIYF